MIDARCFLGDTFGIDKLRPLLRLFYKYEPIRIHCSAQGRREEGSSRTVEVVVATEVHLRPQRGGGGRREASENVQRATAAGHVLLRPLPEAPRGEGLPLRLVRELEDTLLLSPFYSAVQSVWLPDFRARELQGF